MTGAFVDNAAQFGVSMIDPHAEDRWIGTPVRKASLAMSGVVLASLVIHAGLLLLAATFGDRAPPPLAQETTVELVREPPPAPKPREVAKDAGKDGSPDASKDAGAPEAPKAEKPEPAKVEPAKVESAKVEAANAEPPKPETVKPEAAKPQPDPPKPEIQKAAEAKPAATPTDDPSNAEKEAALRELKQELDGLKAEQDALKAENAAAAAEAQMQTADKTPDGFDTKGIGAIPPSFGAALPQLSEVAGEATGYEQIVFSQLAKTKGIRRHMGQAGTAGIVFTIDKSGRLARVAIAHPSGSAALDDEAMRIVTGSAPFPKPPPGATRTISANFNFNYVPQPAP